MVKQLVSDPASALHRHLVPDKWGPHEENLAQLLEIAVWQAENTWAQLTHDPDSEEARRARAKAKHDGIKPPPHPVFPPVAQRPARLAEERFRQYLAEVTAANTPRAAETAPSTVSRAAFEAAHGIT